jgi:hypothetical protein
MAQRRILWLLSPVLLGFGLNPQLPSARPEATAAASAADTEGVRPLS